MPTIHPFKNPFDEAPKAPTNLGGSSAGGFRMLQEGGIITGPTFALLGEAGPEAVIPLGRGGGLGPAVHIENAHFNEGADIDLLMERVAFATAARKL